MTTIVYKEEMITSKSPNSGTPRNVQTKTFTVQIMGDAAPNSGGSRTTSKSLTQRHSRVRGGSPKPNKKYDVRSKFGKQASYSYNPHVFTITAYLPHDGGKRLKLQCSPGQSVQQVIESEIPNISQTGYQVYQFPSRALLNPEKDASVLQDQEISIEPMRATSPDEVDDDRLAIVKELLRSEDTYLENLRNIFDIYMEPLKKWGLPQTDMNVMFRSLSRLCDLLMNFFSELELSIKHWNTNTTLIGGLFKQYRSFWDMYSEYSQSYSKACKLLKDKHAMDESFNRFLEMKRGAAMHTLESLMLLPVQRMYEYHKLLMRLYSLTPKTHPDYHDLRYTITAVGSLVQARDQQLNQNQNEIKLEQVQDRFPNDNLQLFQPLDIMEARSSKRSKAYMYGHNSSGGTPVRHMKSSHHHAWMSTPALTPTSQDNVDGSDTKKTRLYLSEGPVRMYSGVQSHDRYLFLFDDLLIISKPIKQKSQHKMFKRKGQLRLSEMWATECLDKSLESILIDNTYFVIGWPFTNCVAAFSTPEEKTLWFNLLRKYIEAQRQIDEPEKISQSVQILNFTNSSSHTTPTWISVHPHEEARALLSKAIEIMAIAVSEGNCQLGVKISKDEIFLLVGHEYPYAIQKFHNRHRLEYSDKPSQLQFIIKRKEASQLIVPKSAHKKISLPWKRPKLKTKKHYRKVFGAPLSELIVNSELPELLQDILSRIFLEGPGTRGIFRHSANFRKVQNLMDSINNREHVKLYDCTIHEIGALLKNLLRKVPGGILHSSRYTEFVATNDIKDVQVRVQQIQRVVFKLPNENQLFLRYLMPLLHHIARAQEVNGMNSVNLAICFAPSLLWPSSGLDVIKNEVPPLIMFFVERCPDIFGAELPVLYRQLDLPALGVENMEFSVNVPATQEFVPTKVDDGEYSQTNSKHKHTESICSSMSEESTTAETEDDNTASLQRARKSGLTLSDSQLSQISQLDDYESSVLRTRQVRKRGVIEASGKHIHQTETRVGMLQSPVGRPSPKRVKKARIPERSSSLHGPNDMLYNRANYVRTRQVNETLSRRKSIAVQEPVLPRKSDFVNEFEAIPPSPNSSYSSSSHSYSPRMMRRIHHSHEYYSGYGRHEDSSSHSKSPKRKRMPQYSHSFTSKDMEKPNRYIPSSTSFYDKLLPLDAEVSRGRSEHHSPSKFITRLDLLSSEGETHQPRPILTTTQQTSFANNSTQSIVSSSSNQTRPSNISLTPGGSGSSLNRVSPDLMIQTNVERGEFLKVAISERFKLNGSSGSGGNGDYPQASAMAPTSYSNDRVIISVAPSRDEFASPGSESGQDSLERIQKKFQERKRLGSEGSESAFSKSSNYKVFLNAQQKKDSLMSLAEESSIDDRPECDFHLGSLSRRRSGFIQDSDPNKPYTNNGYNSDTESAPSRTLSRPGKILEVNSPTKTTMSSRYFVKTQSERTLSSQPSSYTHLQQQQQQQQQQSRILQQGSHPQHQMSSVAAELPTSLESSGDDYATETPPVPMLAEPLVATTRTITKSDKPSGSRRRPKSGDNSRVEKLTESYQAKEQEAREQEKVNANIEDAKVKLGLIPQQRQRSRSTSEREAMKILHKMESGDIDEINTTTSSPSSSQRDEVKHKEWLSSAPTSAERKQAWENYASKSQFQRMEYKSRSLRTTDVADEKPVPVSTPPSVVSHCTPDTKRKCSTMPDDLSGKQITVKVRMYEIPHPQRIRRINLRTYH